MLESEHNLKKTKDLLLETLIIIYEFIFILKLQWRKSFLFFYSLCSTSLVSVVKIANTKRVISQFRKDF